MRGQGAAICELKAYLDNIVQYACETRAGVVQLKEASHKKWQDIGTGIFSAEKATAASKAVVTTDQAELEGLTVNLGGHVKKRGANLACLRKGVSPLQQQVDQNRHILEAQPLNNWGNAFTPRM